MPEYPSPKHWVRASSACNNNCLFCHDSENRSSAPPAREQISSSLADGIEKGIRALVLSGGEPTLNRDLPAIISEAKSLGYERVQIITNGRAFAYNGYLDKMAEAGLDEVTFSFYSHRENTHDILSNVPGSFVQSLKGLANAVESRKFIVNIDIVINRLNVMTLPETIDFFYTMGVREFDLLYLIPFGRAYENRNMLFMEPAECAGAIKTALLRAREKGARVWANRVPASLLEGCEWSMQSPDKIVTEVLGHSSVFESFLAGGPPPECRGERCPYCFLEDFCLRLEEQELMRRGRETPEVFIDLSFAGPDFPGDLSTVTNIKELWLAGSLKEIEVAVQKLSAAPPGSAPAISICVSEPYGIDPAIRRIMQTAPGLNITPWITAVPPGAGAFKSSEAEFWITLSTENIRFASELCASDPPSGKRIVFVPPSFFNFTNNPSSSSAGAISLISDIPFGPAGIYGLPECVCGDIPRIQNKPFFYLGNLDASGRISIEKFARSYIKHQNSAKPLRCGQCRRDSVCPGVRVNDILNGLGLGSCSPIG